MLSKQGVTATYVCVLFGIASQAYSAVYEFTGDVLSNSLSTSNLGQSTVGDTVRIVFTVQSSDLEWIVPNTGHTYGMHENSLELFINDSMTLAGPPEYTNNAFGVVDHGFFVLPGDPYPTGYNDAVGINYLGLLDGTDGIIMKSLLFDSTSTVIDGLELPTSIDLTDFTESFWLIEEFQGEGVMEIEFTTVRVVPSPSVVVCPLLILWRMQRKRASTTPRES